jgi:hypothetical protein
MEPSKAALKALRYALYRPRGNICPIPGVCGAAQTALIKCLVHSGWATNAGAPRITVEGCRVASLPDSPA